MNQYFLMDISLRKGYTEHKPALEKLLSILFPHHDKKDFWESPHDCDEINNTIDKFIKDKLGKATADLCLDYFVELFGDESIDCEKVTISQTIHEIVKHKDIIRKNIKERCKE